MFRLLLGLTLVGQILIVGLMLNASEPLLIQEPVLTAAKQALVVFSPAMVGAALGAVLCGSWLRRLWASDLQGVPFAAVLTTLVRSVSGGALFVIALVALPFLLHALGAQEPSAYAHLFHLCDALLPLYTMIGGPVVAAGMIFSSVPGALWWTGSNARCLHRPAE